MGSSKTSLEVIADTVEEAVAQGAAELGATPDQVLVEVIDEGSKMASRQARVRLSLLRKPADDTLDDNSLQATEAVVRDLLDHLAVRGTVQARWGEPEEADQEHPLLVDIEGDDLSILIGHRGETLAALQYITRLIVARELGRPTPVIIDVEGYRARRERQLRQLARRMADQAVERARTMTLEPMPANERRIIHLELRDDEKVYTESVGEGDQRKVTIIPRSQPTT
ncbi:MAG TPA: RNA-binding cell elongation regulator Jag/EloR [Anaerolineales bacterium]|nr:RNA-binding cell elongation regulator Jag/EloR [Anaerolineales bacterium]